MRDSAAHHRLQIPLRPNGHAAGRAAVKHWSPLDIISGNLVYFDHPRLAPFPESMVTNLRDPACTIPLAAHTQYWNGKLLRKTVYDQLDVPITPLPAEPRPPLPAARSQP